MGQTVYNLLKPATFRNFTATIKNNDLTYDAQALVITGENGGD